MTAGHSIMPKSDTPSVMRAKPPPDVAVMARAPA
jgi:hypothetical protein